MTSRAKTPRGRPEKPPADCPIGRTYPCRFCWFWREEKCQEKEITAEARANVTELLSEEEARHRFPSLFED